MRDKFSQINVGTNLEETTFPLDSRQFPLPTVNLQNGSANEMMQPLLIYDINSSHQLSPPFELSQRGLQSHNHDSHASESWLHHGHRLHEGIHWLEILEGGLNLKFTRSLLQKSANLNTLLFANKTGGLLHSLPLQRGFCGLELAFAANDIRQHWGQPELIYNLGGRALRVGAIIATHGTGIAPIVLGLDLIYGEQFQKKIIPAVISGAKDFATVSLSDSNRIGLDINPVNRYIFNKFFPQDKNSNLEKLNKNEPVIKAWSPTNSKNDQKTPYTPQSPIFDFGSKVIETIGTLTSGLLGFSSVNAGSVEIPLRDTPVPIFDLKNHIQQQATELDFNPSLSYDFINPEIMQRLGSAKHDVKPKSFLFPQGRQSNDSKLNTFSYDPTIKPFTGVSWRNAMPSSLANAKFGIRYDSDSSDSGVFLDIPLPPMVAGIVLAGWAAYIHRHEIAKRGDDVFKLFTSTKYDLSSLQKEVNQSLSNRIDSDILDQTLDVPRNRSRIKEGFVKIYDYADKMTKAAARDVSAGDIRKASKHLLKSLVTRDNANELFNKYYYKNYKVSCFDEHTGKVYTDTEQFGVYLDGHEAFSINKFKAVKKSVVKAWVENSFKVKKGKSIFKSKIFSGLEKDLLEYLKSAEPSDFLFVEMLKACSDKKNSVDVDKIKPEIFVGLQNKSIKDKDYETAIFYNEKAEKILPNSPFVLLNKGYLNSQRGNKVESITSFKKILELSPDSKDIKVKALRGLMHEVFSGLQEGNNFEQGKLNKDMLKEFNSLRDLLKKNGNVIARDAELRLGKCQVENCLGEYDAAITGFEKIQRDFKSDEKVTIKALRGLRSCYCAKEEFKEALGYINKICVNDQCEQEDILFAKSFAFARIQQAQLKCKEGNYKPEEVDRIASIGGEAAKNIIDKLEGEDKEKIIELNEVSKDICSAMSKQTSIQVFALELSNKVLQSYIVPYVSYNKKIGKKAKIAVQGTSLFISASMPFLVSRITAGEWTRDFRRGSWVDNSQLVVGTLMSITDFVCYMKSNDKKTNSGNVLESDNPRGIKQSIKRNLPLIKESAFLAINSGYSILRSYKDIQNTIANGGNGLHTFGKHAGTFVITYGFDGFELGMKWAGARLPEHYAYYTVKCVTKRYAPNIMFAYAKRHVIRKVMQIIEKKVCKIILKIAAKFALKKVTKGGVKKFVGGALPVIGWAATAYFVYQDVQVLRNKIIPLNQTRAKFSNAVKLIEQQRCAGAVSKLKECLTILAKIKKDSSSDGEIDDLEGQIKKAWLYCEKIKLSPLLNRARELGEYTNVIQKLVELLEVFSGDEELEKQLLGCRKAQLFVDTQSLLKKNQFDEAINGINRFIKNYERDNEIDQLVRDCKRSKIRAIVEEKINNKQYDAAINAVEKFLKEMSGDFFVKKLLSQCYKCKCQFEYGEHYKKENFIKAAGVARDFLSKNDDADIYILERQALLSYYISQKNYDSAIKEGLEILNKDSKNESVRRTLAQLYLRKSDYSSVKQQVKNLSRTSDFATCYIVANFYFAVCADYFKGMIANHPHFTSRSAYRMIGKVESEQKQIASRRFSLWGGVKSVASSAGNYVYRKFNIRMDAWFELMIKDYESKGYNPNTSKIPHNRDFTWIINQAKKCCMFLLQKYDSSENKRQAESFYAKVLMLHIKICLHDYREFKAKAEQIRKGKSLTNVTFAEYMRCASSQLYEGYASIEQGNKNLSSTVLLLELEYYRMHLKLTEEKVGEAIQIGETTYSHLNKISINRSNEDELETYKVACENVSQLLAELYLSKGFYKKLHTLCQKQIGKNKNNMRIIEIDALAYFEQKEWRKANECFENLFHLKTSRIEYYVKAIHAYCELEQHAEAGGLCTAVLKSSELDVVHNEKISLLTHYMVKLKIEGEIVGKNYIEMSWEKLGSSNNVRESLNTFGEWYFQSGNFIAAKRCLQRTLVFCPNNFDAYSALLQVLLALNEFDDAGNVCHKAIDKIKIAMSNAGDIQQRMRSNFIDTLKGYYEISSRLQCYKYMKAKKYKLLVLNLEQRLAKDPNDLFSLRFLVNAYLKIEKHTKAFNFVKKLLQLCPDDFEANLTFIELSISLGNLQQAIEHIDKMLGKQNFKKFPSKLQQVNEIRNKISCQLMLQDKEFQELLVLCEKQISSKNNEGFHRNIKAKVYLERGQIDLAESELMKILMLDENHYEALMQLAQLAESKHNYDAAVFYMRKALLLVKDKPKITMHLQKFIYVALFNKNDPAVLHNECSSALLNNPKDVVALFFRGQAFLRQGNLVAAKQDFLKVVTLNPLHMESHLQLLRLLTDRCKFAEAKKYTFKLIKIASKLKSPHKERYKKVVEALLSKLEKITSIERNSGSHNRYAFYSTARSSLEHGGDDVAIQQFRNDI